ncbi:diacylglycerol kinase [Campylobacter sp. RM13119]|uniref:diacylglycerol kinase n=1 Tax=Campylobacter TaxID=194 RepID=UPI0014763021|nr:MULTISPECIES: diacylglycerol kinase [unclassified Campylobacter]MBE3606562.1 diacylglycerol kinase [Campylobacter sp. RM13119]MBE3610234.1 diacylglycerol kinase [Campylobacter sp. RM12916]
MRNQPKYKFFKNWSYAIDGFKDIYANESSFRLELVVFTALGLSLFYWKFDLILNLAIIFSMTLVLVCECLNSAIERVVDLASPNIHPLAKCAKDAASSAVMICNFLCGGFFIYALVTKF